MTVVPAERVRRLFGIEIHDLDMTEAVAAVEALHAQGRSALVVTPNAQHVDLLGRDRDFRAAYREADLVLPDSAPLVWASRWLGRPLRQRVTGADLLPALCAAAERNGWSVFLLGAAPGVAARAGERLLSACPGLRIAGVHSPEPGFESDPVRAAATVDLVRAAGADLLFVGLGSPKGEAWAWRNRRQAGAKVTACVGAGLDFAAGVRSRAPRWMRPLGLEWLYRLVREPRRLWKRYVFGNARFLIRLLDEAVSPDRAKRL